MGLLGLRALRGLCGFCVREWLGGLKACGVFASVFLLLLLCLPPFMLVVLLCSGCLSFVLLRCLCGSLGVVVVSFSLSDYTQKERAQFLASSLVLLCACISLVLSALLRVFVCSRSGMPLYLP